MFSQDAIAHNWFQHLTALILDAIFQCFLHNYEISSDSELMKNMCGLSVLLGVFFELILFTKTSILLDQKHKLSFILDAC